MLLFRSEVSNWSKPVETLRQRGRKPTKSRTALLRAFQNTPGMTWQNMRGDVAQYVSSSSQNSIHIWESVSSVAFTANYRLRQASGTRGAETRSVAAWICFGGGKCCRLRSETGRERRASRRVTWWFMWQWRNDPAVMNGRRAWEEPEGKSHFKQEITQVASCNFIGGHCSSVMLHFIISAARLDWYKREKWHNLWSFSF